jgi:hypothetical protein
MAGSAFTLAHGSIYATVCPVTHPIKAPHQTDGNSHPG